jgi:hypothetical protein
VKENDMADNATYRDAPEVAKIAKDLIRENHPRLSLDKIMFLFTSKLPTKGGKIVLGKAGLITELEAALFGEDGDGIDADFYCIITGSEWVVSTDERKVAIVDHELCHMYYDLDNEKPKIAEHDIADFNEVIRRHGLWNEDTRKTAKVMQPYLPGLEEVELEDGSAIVDTATGEITPIKPAPRTRKKRDGFGNPINEGLSSVTISSGDKSVTLTSETGKNIDKLLKKKRGAVADGPQAPAGG